MITNINIERIYPHRDNPRKDLGDLKELAASIKVTGILQNLTVVPTDMDSYQKKISSKKAYLGNYTVIIGHRRLAAAKLAGLTYVPCTVSDMDEKQQISTMLLENMQRTDLKLIEQVDGFQMMLDMGSSEAEISKQTGLSKTTVHQRVKLAELDRDKLTKGVERGATLADFAKLDKLSDPDLKDKVLDKIGTANFANELKNAMADEKWQKQRKQILDTLESFATYVEDDDSTYRAVKFFSRYGINEAQVPDDTGEREYFYSITDHHIKLLVEHPKDNPSPGPGDQEETAEARKWRLIRERRSELEALTARCYELRYEFIKGFHAAKRHSKEIICFMIRVLFDECMEGLGDRFIELLGALELSDGDEWSFETIAELCEASPECVLLAAAYDSYGDYRNMGYHNFDCKHDENLRLDILYEFLVKLGYQMSDEERQFQDGTHELFNLDFWEQEQVGPE